jgi:hypothetical protein
LLGAVLQVGCAETDYFFTCMDYTTMMADLNDPAGNCSLSAAGAQSLQGLSSTRFPVVWPKQDGSCMRQCNLLAPVLVQGESKWTRHVFSRSNIAINT